MTDSPGGEDDVSAVGAAAQRRALIRYLGVSVAVVCAALVAVVLFGYVTVDALISAPGHLHGVWSIAALVYLWFLVGICAWTAWKDARTIFGDRERAPLPETPTIVQQLRAFVTREALIKHALFAPVIPLAVPGLTRDRGLPLWCAIATAAAAVLSWELLLLIALPLQRRLTTVVQFLDPDRPEPTK